MESFFRDAFISISSQLNSSQDILSFCLTNKQHLEYCQEPNFWRDVIRLRFGLIVDNATSWDFDFLIEIDNNEPLEDILRLVQPQTKKKILEIVTTFKAHELKDWASNQPYLY